MISQNTIDQIRDLDIVQVIEKYITLKKSGSSYKALSPFTDEKTPSFHVSPAKQIFKCFSTGKGGDAISFVCEHLKLDYPEAIKELASQFAISIEYEKETPAKKKTREKEQSQKAAIGKALDYALAWFQFNDVPKLFSKLRSFPAKTLNRFSVGYAPPGKDNFAKDAKKAGLSMAVLEAAGLVRNSKGTIYDAYQDRIIFPVFDINNNVLSFTGRLAHEVPADAKFIPPKYFNSPDTVWQKGAHLYGLNWAHRAIKDLGFAYLVEGLTDVIRTHMNGLTNSVGSCGTSLTVNQCKLLHRFTDQVTIIPDNDLEKEDNPGLKAMHRNAQLLLKNGFAVKVLLPGTIKSRKNTDPDDWLRRLNDEDEINKWLANAEDYITYYLYRECIAIGDSSAKDLANQIQRMADVIESIADYTLRTIYYDQVAAIWAPFKKKYKLKAAPKTVELPQLDKLKKEERAEYFDFGFWEDRNCYYSMGQQGKEFRFTNFKIDILYFVVSDNEPQYVCIFTNIFGKRRIKAIKTDDFTSVGPFKKAIGRLGNYLFEGTEHHLNKIKLKLFHGVKEVSMPPFIGFNPNGNYFTWSNGLYNGHFHKTDKYGIVMLKNRIQSIEDFHKLKPETHLMLKDEQFVISNPSDFVSEFASGSIEKYIEASEAYRLNYYYLPFASNLRLTEDEDDIFEFERRYKHTEVTGGTFKEWANLMVSVYGDNGKVAILFYIMSLFRDVIFKANNSYVPMLGLFGPRQSGKSTLARSMGRMFGQPLDDGINLESGSTATGIRRILASCQNTIITLNEYKNSLPDAVLAMIKGISDGSGKLTGRNTAGNETKNYRPRSCSILAGQDLPTQDPAIFSRVVVCSFDVKNRNHEGFRELINFENSGVTTGITCQVLSYRKFIEENYVIVEPEVTKVIRKKLQEAELEVDDRLVLNYTSLLTPYFILQNEIIKPKLEFPFTEEELWKIFIDKAIGHIEIQNTSDDVEQYLQVVASLVNKEIFEGTHYKIDGKITGQSYLYLRLQQIHIFYRSAANRAGMNAYDIATIKQYLSKHPVFIEYKSSVRFGKNNPTSAIVLDYNKLHTMGIEFHTEYNLKQTTI